MHLKKKLIVVMSLVAIVISVLSISINAYLTLTSMKEETLLQYEEGLKSKRVLLTLEIEDYFLSIKHQIQTMSASIFTVEATNDFTQAFNDYPKGVNAVELESYYQNQFKAVFDEQNKQPVSIGGLFNDLPDITLALQSKWIAENSHPLGEKDSLAALHDGSDYDVAHQRYHPSFRKFLQSFGFYDIFIVEPDNGYIVYSVFKELDYATSLTSGPYKDSGIAQAYNAALSLSEGEVYLTDFNAYLPSYNNAASFMSSPIYENGEVKGVLIYQMPINVINGLMTQHSKWKESGFGETGEAYLVGSDGTLRSESRFFMQQKAMYLSALKATGFNTVEIENKGTGISLQPVTSAGAQAALKGQSGFSIFKDYRGEQVISSYGPIEVGGLKWAMMSEIDEEEVLHGLDTLKAEMIVTTSLIILGVAVISIIIAVIFAGSLTRPLNQLAERFADLSKGDADLTTRVKKSGTPEIDAIGEGFNQFIERLNGVIVNVKDAVNRIASSGTQLNVSSEQSQSLINMQTVSMQDVHDSIIAFAESVEKITEQTISASKATEVAQKTAEENAQRADLASDNINQLVEEVTKSANFISELQGNVQDISDVLGVINSIADQTNLLALNAAIEAARAGDHGRGFAVVADEVRTLAKRTQESTVTIQKQIDQLTAATNNSVESMERASVSAKGGIHLVEIVSETLQQLREVVVDLSTMNSDISHSSQNQSVAIKTINQTIEGLKEQSVEMTNTSNSVVGVTHELAQVSEGVKSDMDRFVV